MGQDGSDRVTIIWPDGAIKNQWLRVVVKANEEHLSDRRRRLLLRQRRRRIGQYGGNAIVNATDEIMARNFLHGPLNRAAIDDPYDFNRDRLVNATDQIIARNNYTNPLTMLRLITATTAVSELLHNGGFETGDFSGWTVGNDRAMEMDQWTVGPAGGGFFFDSSPHSGDVQRLQRVRWRAGQQYTLLARRRDPGRPRFGQVGRALPHSLRRRESCHAKPHIQDRGLRSGRAMDRRVVPAADPSQRTPARTSAGLRREFDLSAYAGKTVRIQFTEIIPERTPARRSSNWTTSA